MGNALLVGGLIMLIAIGIAVALVIARQVFFPAQWDSEDNEILRERRERILNR